MCQICKKMNVYTFIKDKIYIRRTLNGNKEPKRFNIIDKDNLSAITLDFEYCPFCGESMTDSNINEEVKIDIPVVQLRNSNLSNKTINLLSKAGYNTLDQIFSAGLSSIFKVKYMDDKRCIDEIIGELNRLGYDTNTFIRM